jgi:transketolase
MEISLEKIQELKEIAREVRCHVVKMINLAQVGHPGGSLSAVDLLVALYFHIMRIDPLNPNWEERDRFILSKGHAASALYATLALKGFFALTDLETFGKINSKLQVHPDMRKVPGVEASTGALGQGLSIGVGLALGGRLSRLNYHVYVLMGDGELQEGQVWEAAMCASHYKLDNLTAIVDYNQVQLMGPIDQVMSIGNLNDKWNSFGWSVFEIDGHNFSQIVDACLGALSTKGKPSVIIAHTVKGKGCSFMEGRYEWHGKPLSNEDLVRALKELRGEQK